MLDPSPISNALHESLNLRYYYGDTSDSNDIHQNSCEENYNSEDSINNTYEGVHTLDTPNGSLTHLSNTLQETNTDTSVLSNNKNAIEDLNPKYSNYLYHLLNSSHTGKVLLKAYEEFEKKNVGNVEIPLESDNDEDDANFISDDFDEYNYVCEDQGLDKYFSRIKLCHIVMEYEVSKFGYE